MYSCSICSNKMDFAVRPIFRGPVTLTINTMSLNLKICTVVLIRLHKKADLLEMKVNGMKDRKVHVDKDKQKNGGHTPSSLGGRSILGSGRQTDDILAVYKIFKIHQL